MRKGEIGIYCEERGKQIEYKIKRGGQQYMVHFLSLSYQEQLRVIGMLAQGIELLRDQLKEPTH